jgi:gamma-glutamyltranspeptidase/glutathione hydrolase
LLTEADFTAYRVRQSEPLRCAYKGHLILSAPPPSSGGTVLCEVLAILEPMDLPKLGFHGAASVHLMTEALRSAFLDRNTFLGDPAFVNNPLDRLLSPAHTAALRQRISDRATPSALLATPDLAAEEKPETTHYSVLDAQGGAAAVTFTLNGGFGAGVIAGDTGFFINDEMDDFTLKPGQPNQFGLVQGSANAIVPGKRPLSSMAPTIVMKDGRVELVLGSPGGSRIISTVLETILNIVDFGMNAQEAADAPRLHHQWMPDILFAEPMALSPDTSALLRGMGYRIQVQAPWGAMALIAAGDMMAAGLAPVTADSAANLVHQGTAYYGAIDSRRPAGAALAP